jgi:hypothetical protein
MTQMATDDCLRRLQPRRPLSALGEAEEVGAVEARELLALVRNRKLDLPVERDSAVVDLDREGFLIDGFKESWSELSVHLNGGANDGVRSRIPICGHLCRLWIISLSLAVNCIWSCQRRGRFGCGQQGTI